MMQRIRSIWCILIISGIIIIFVAWFKIPGLGNSVRNNQIQDDWTKGQSVHFFPLVQLEIEIQKNIYQNQFPDEDCETVPKIRCNVLVVYGIAAQITLLRRCLAHAIHVKAVAIIDDRNWNYCYDKCAWTNFFLPLGKCGREYLNRTNVKDWEGSTGSSSLLTSMSQRVYNVVNNFHDDPRVWWTGQFLKYILRFSDSMNQIIIDTKKDIGYEHPIVGVHVRRTDKIKTEASYHPLSEYISRVEAFFILHYPYLKREEKRVFIATDEPTVLNQLMNTTSYKIISSNKHALDAVINRFSMPGLQGILTDIVLLAESTMMIGTFSSKASRIAYELMQTKHVNGYPSGISLLTNDETYREYPWYCEECGRDPYLLNHTRKFNENIDLNSAHPFNQRIERILDDTTKLFK